MSLHSVMARKNKNYTIESTKWLGGVANPVSGSYPAYTMYTNIAYRMSQILDYATSSVNVPMGTNGWPSGSTFRISVSLMPGGPYAANGDMWKGSFISTTQPVLQSNPLITNTNWDPVTYLFTFDITLQPIHSAASSVGFVVNGPTYIIKTLGTTNWGGLGWNTTDNLKGSSVPSVGDYFVGSITIPDTSSSPGTAAPAGDSGNLQLVFSNVTNFNNFQVNTTQDGQGYVSTQRYTNAFINIISSLSHFRTLDWTGTNEIPPWQTNWSDRYWYNDDITQPAGTVDGWQYSPDPTVLFANANTANTRILANQQYDASYPGNSSWSKSWESIITIANDFNTPPWITIPPNVTTNYIERLATLFAKNIRTSVYIEFGNENWNGGLQNYHAIVPAVEKLTNYISNANYANIVVTSNLLTITTKTPHGRSTGDTICWTGMFNQGLNDIGLSTCTVLSTTSFTVPIISGTTTSITGTDTMTVVSNTNQITFSTNYVINSAGQSRGIILTNTGIVVGGYKNTFINDGEFVIGKSYTINTIGNTNWSAVGWLTTNAASGAFTTLQSTITFPMTSGSIPLVSTAGLPGSGMIVLGGITVFYTGYSGNTLTGCTSVSGSGTILTGVSVYKPSYNDTFTATNISSGVTTNLGICVSTNTISLESNYTGVTLTNVNYLYIEHGSMYLTPFVTYAGATVNLVGGQTSSILNLATNVLGTAGSDLTERYAAWMLWCTVSAFKTQFTANNNFNNVKGIYAGQASQPFLTDESLMWALINTNMLGPVNSWINMLSAASYTSSWGTYGYSELNIPDAIYDSTRTTETVTGYMVNGVITITSTIPAHGYPAGTLVTDSNDGSFSLYGIITSTTGNPYTMAISSMSIAGVSTTSVGSIGSPVHFVFTGRGALPNLMANIRQWRQLTTLYNIEDFWTYEGGLDFSNASLVNNLPLQALNYTATPNMGSVLYDTLIAAYNNGVGKFTVTGLLNAGYFNGYGFQIFDDITNINTPQYKDGITPALSYPVVLPNYDGIFTGTINFGNNTGNLFPSVNNVGLPTWFQSTLYSINANGSVRASHTFVHSGGTLNATFAFAIFLPDNASHSIIFCVGSNNATGNLSIYLDGTILNRFSDGLYLGQIIPQYNINESANSGLNLSTYTSVLNFSSCRGFHVISIIDKNVSPGNIYLASATLT